MQPSPSFARLFSSLISSRQKRADDCDDEIDEEASALSYEQALRRHARYRPSEERLVPLEEKPVPSPQIALEPNPPHQDPLCSSPSIETTEPPSQPSGIPAKARASQNRQHHHPPDPAGIRSAAQARLRSRPNGLRLPTFLHIRSRIAACARQRHSGAIAGEFRRTESERSDSKGAESSRANWKTRRPLALEAVSASRAASLILHIT